MQAKTKDSEWFRSAMGQLHIDCGGRGGGSVFQVTNKSIPMARGRHVDLLIVLGGGVGGISFRRF